MRPLLLLAPLGLVVGCDADCSNAARMDGVYTVEANVTADDWVVTGWEANEQTDQTTHLYGLFVNGSSTWELRNQPSAGGVRVTIDGQQFDAPLTVSDDNCNAFTLELAGQWNNPENGATHQFAWVGDLVWTGDALGGTWSYDDQWGLDGRTGSVSISKGELQASLRGGGGGADSGR